MDAYDDDDDDDDSSSSMKITVCIVTAMRPLYLMHDLRLIL